MRPRACLSSNISSACQNVTSAATWDGRYVEIFEVMADLYSFFPTMVASRLMLEE